MNTDQMLDARQARRMASDGRYEARIYAREDAAERLIGTLCREGKTVFYINTLTKDGALTGKTREGTRLDLTAFLIRNNYV